MTVDLTTAVPAASSWFVGDIDEAKIQQYVSDYLEALRQASEPSSQRVQMVQTSSQSITAVTWTTLTSMSYTSANLGHNGVTGMGAISSGLLTMPTGSAGQWEVSGQVAFQGASGLAAIRGAVVKNGARLIAAGAVAAGSVTLQAVEIPAFEIALADGDTIGLQGWVSGAATSTATFTANDGGGSFLRLVKLP